MNPTFNPLDHPDAEIPRAYFCQLTGRSKITAYRHEDATRTGPNRSSAAAVSSTRRRTASDTWRRCRRMAERSIRGSTR